MNQKIIDSGLIIIEHVMASKQQVEVIVDGKKTLGYTSNDYNSFASDPRVSSYTIQTSDDRMRQEDSRWQRLWHGQCSSHVWPIGKIHRPNSCRTSITISSLSLLTSMEWGKLAFIHPDTRPILDSSNVASRKMMWSSLTEPTTPQSLMRWNYARQTEEFTSTWIWRCLNNN